MSLVEETKYFQDEDGRVGRTKNCYSMPEVLMNGEWISYEATDWPFRFTSITEAEAKARIESAGGG